MDCLLHRIAWKELIVPGEADRNTGPTSFGIFWAASALSLVFYSTVRCYERHCTQPQEGKVRKSGSIVADFHVLTSLPVLGKCHGMRIQAVRTTPCVCSKEEEYQRNLWAVPDGQCATD
ncbi:hypothetical protein NDU88_004762 [Pleurodeles waltl]|uniref:Uncharacterized protein n=1 Tax=Pleurodeles waltl TaxID=8319 RepID=A0AAV7V621_PLEWA|nr:hypothetical protein NDU88_004762 [Pleurodeles waltl]